MPRLSRVAIIAGAAAGAVAFVTMFESAQTSKSTATPMTQSMDNRFSSAGGAGDHTGATATKLGSEENRELGGGVKDKGAFLGPWIAAWVVRVRV